MTNTVKTDNHSLETKVELRRYFVDRYHPAGTEKVRIFDCCQGDGMVWKTIMPMFPDRAFRYWGVDVKPKPGRLRIDSVRVLQQSGWNEDVVDIDTYGSPWKHWFALMPNLKKAVTVFFTIGLVKIGGGRLDDLAIKAIGLDAFEKIPPSLVGKMGDLTVDYCLAACRDYGLKITELIEAFPQKNARYIGARVELASPPKTR